MHEPTVNSDMARNLRTGSQHEESREETGEKHE
jgi:hypothetical protein